METESQKNGTDATSLYITMADAPVRGSGSLNRLLLADNDPGFASIVQELASRLDCSVQVTPDFPSFEKAYTDFDPEVILLGLQIKDRDGIELIRYLSERRCRAYIVVVADADLKILEAAERLGRSRRLSMLPSVQKPVTVSTLRTLLRSLIDAPIAISLAELRAGIDSGGFVPYFQPVLGLGRPQHGFLRMEVLARWNHPFHGMLAASEFIEAAEEHGVVAEMTFSLLTQALKRAGACRKAGLSLPLSLNISAKTLTDLDLPDQLAGIVAEHGFENSAVMLELTESTMTEDRLEILDVLTRLRLKGFRLSMDDFGTGYSTLLELVRLPFNEIKIDQRFMKKLEVRRESDVVIGSTVGLAHGLGMTVCAEGVETRKTLEFLRRAGCDAAQGRYIHEPVSGEDLMACLREWRGHTGAPSEPDAEAASEELTAE